MEIIIDQLTPRKIDNIINKYNKRIESVAKTIGINNALYETYTVLLSNLTGETRTKTVQTSTGETITIMQSKRGKVAINKVISSKERNPTLLETRLKKLNKQNTIKTFLNDIRKNHHDIVYKGKQVSDMTGKDLYRYITTFTSLVSELGNRIFEVYSIIGTDLKDFNEYTLDQLENMIDRINEDYDNTEFMDEPPDDVFGVEIPY